MASLHLSLNQIALYFTGWDLLLRILLFAILHTTQYTERVSKIVHRISCIDSEAALSVKVSQSALQSVQVLFQ